MTKKNILICANPKCNNKFEKYKKKKCDSRKATGDLLNRRNGYRKNNPLKKECKKCYTKENLEIHHEIYPKFKKEIIEAILKRKIYYLCKICHGRGNNHKL